MEDVLITRALPSGDVFPDAIMSGSSSLVR